MKKNPNDIDGFLFEFDEDKGSCQVTSRSSCQNNVCSYPLEYVRHDTDILTAEVYDVKMFLPLTDSHFLMPRFIRPLQPLLWEIFSPSRWQSFGLTLFHEANDTYGTKYRWPSVRIDLINALGYFSIKQDIDPYPADGLYYRTAWVQSRKKKYNG